MFQAAYRAKAEELGADVVHTVKAKLTNLAAVTLDMATERIESGLASERFLGETMKNTLASLGYGAPVAPSSGQPQLHVHVDATRLVEARERAALVRAGTTQARLGDGDSSKDSPEPVQDFIDVVPEGSVQ